MKNSVPYKHIEWWKTGMLIYVYILLVLKIMKFFCNYIFLCHSTQHFWIIRIMITQLFKIVIYFWEAAGNFLFVFKIKMFTFCVSGKFIEFWTFSFCFSSHFVCFFFFFHFLYKTYHINRNMVHAIFYIPFSPLFFTRNKKLHTFFMCNINFLFFFYAT